MIIDKSSTTALAALGPVHFSRWVGHLPFYDDLSSPFHYQVLYRDLWSAVYRKLCQVLLEEIGVVLSAPHGHPIRECHMCKDHAFNILTDMEKRATPLKDVQSPLVLLAVIFKTVEGACIGCKRRWAARREMLVGAAKMVPAFSQMPLPS